jgi:hypothetical protein
MRLYLGKGWQTLVGYCRLGLVVGLVPGIDGAAGVDRRDRRELQLYGIDVFSRRSLCVALREAFREDARVSPHDSRAYFCGGAISRRSRN